MLFLNMIISAVVIGLVLWLAQHSPSAAGFVAMLLIPGCSMSKDILSSKPKPAALNLKVLEKKCKQDGCCLASVRSMERTHAILFERAYSHRKLSCPPGYSLDQLKCKTSYRWCAPLQEPNKQK